MIKSEIINLRAEIDHIDEAIAKLLSRRIDCASKIGFLKDKLRNSTEDGKISAYDPIRENEIIDRLIKIVPDVPSNGIEIIFRQIISLCRNEAHKFKLCLYGHFGEFDFKQYFGFFCEQLVCMDTDSWLEELKKNQFNIGLTSSVLSENIEKELIIAGFKCFKTNKCILKNGEYLRIYAHE